MSEKIKPLDGVSVILDRDGTVIEEKHYLSDPDSVKFLPGAIGALRLLAMSGAKLYIVTNQSGIGRGYFDLNAYCAVEAKVLELLNAEGVEIEDTVYCPHSPEAGCACRKPGIGMWEKLRNKFSIRPEYTLMLGDKFDDIKFGLNSGLAANILVLTGYGRKTAEEQGFCIPRRQRGHNVCEVCNSDHLAQTLHTPGSTPDKTEPHAIAENLLAAAAWIIQNFRRDCPCRA